VTDGVGDNLISIIDKENILWGRNEAPSQRNLGGKFNKAGIAGVDPEIWK